MKLYDYTPAPSPRRIRMLLAEKGVEVERVQIDLGVRAQFGDDYRAVNPRCTVPALQLDDGTVLCDTASITRYVEEVYPDPPMLGRDPIEKALVAEWLARTEWEGLSAVMEGLRNHSKFFKTAALTGPDAYTQIPELAERGRSRAQRFYNVLDERLGQTAYLAGDAFSAADIAAWIFVEFSAWVKLAPGEEHGHLLTWHDAIKARPSAEA